MKKLTTVLAFTLALGFSAAALAQTPQTPVVDKRQDRQEKRIEQGERTGSLTEREERKLEAGQDRIDAKEAAAKADGKVTAGERARLQHAQNKQSRKIRRQKHDGQSKN